MNFPEHGDNVTDADYETVERDEDEGDDGRDDTGDGEFNDGDVGGLNGEIVSADDAHRALSTNGGAVSGLYAGYEPHEAEELRQAIRETRDIILGSAVETGRALARVKALVKHGKFEDFVAVEFPMISKRTAQNLMNLAEAVEAALALYDTSGEQKLLTYPQTILYEVGSKMSDEARADIVEGMINDKFESEDEILEAVREAKEKAKAERKSSKGGSEGGDEGDDDGAAKLTPTEMKAQREDSQRRSSAWNLAVAIVAGTDDGGEDRISVDDVLSRYGECVRSPKHPANTEDHAMVSRTFLAVAQAYKKGGIDSANKLKPHVTDEPVKAAPKAPAAKVAKAPKAPKAPSARSKAKKLDEAAAAETEATPEES
jgi:hypothetical protein